jgi:hypothetical protein
MRRPTTYEQTLERLKTQGTREQECFSRAVAALRGKGTAEEFSATITDARAAIDKLVQDPELFTSRRAAVAGADATSLMAALGYAPLEGLPGRFEFRGATTPVVLRRLALASASLEAALREEPTRRAAQRFDHLPPEPPLGVSGTTTLTLLSGSTPPQRRRYDSDDVLEKVMGWLRAASERNVGVEDVALVHPRRELTPEDLKRTLQGLGLWPSATLKLRGDAPPPPPPPRPSNKPKPSDIFKKIKMARKRAEREERAAYRSAPAPA